MYYLVLLDSVGLGGEGRDRKKEGQVMCGSFTAVTLIIVCELAPVVTQP
jgi:hypothetical protein